MPNDVVFKKFEEASLPFPNGSLYYGTYQSAYWTPLPQVVDAKITSRLQQNIVRSWDTTCPVKKDRLAYVQLKHWDLNQQSRTGELIVYSDLIMDIIQIFGDLYQEKYPIEKMHLIDNYDANDEKSMEDNNSSAFCSRDMPESIGVLSLHSLGRAIDINPKFNPYYNSKTGIILPKESKPYLDRNKVKPGMIRKGDACYKAFVKYGWEWGGDWQNPDPTDYQHFEKEK